MLTVTIDDVLSWGPCYPEAQIHALAEGLPERCTAADLVRHLQGRIPPKDLLWLLCRDEVLPARLLRECVCDWTERALRLAGVTDAASWYAVAVARRYARGEATDAELRTAAARSIALYDPRFAAMYVARYAAQVAALEAGLHPHDAREAWHAAGDWATVCMADDLCERVLAMEAVG